MRNKIVAVVGMCGAGKSAVSDFLVDRGFHYLRFGQVTMDEIIRRGLEPNEALEKEIREGFRKRYGMGAFAILNQPKIDEFIKEGNVVADGLYSWEEYKILKKEYGDSLQVWAVHASPELRYSRLQKRKLDASMKNRPISNIDAKKRDYSEIENIEKGGPIAMADYHIVNDGSFSELVSKLEGVLIESVYLRP